MAVFTDNNLYPGRIDTAMPGFTGNSVRVYLDITEHNSINDIKAGAYLQVSLRYQTSNENALSDPSGIVFKTLTLSSGTKYYFDLLSSDLAEGFTRYEYYKLQFRFTDKGATDYSSGPIDTWLSTENGNNKTNLDNSSEWSTVCLIRQISDFDLQVEGWEAGGTSSSPTQVSLASLYDISGFIKFDEMPPGDSEYLKSVQITWADKDSGVIYTDSYGNSYNKFKNDFRYNFIAGNTYNIKITATTNTLYIKDFYYTVTIDAESQTLQFNPAMTFESSEEEGLIKLNLTYTYTTANTVLYILRTCAKDNYEYKEKIYEGPLLTGTNKTVSYIDYSIESGLLYKYTVMAKTSSNSSAEKPSNPNPIGVVFDHSYLKHGNQQLKLKFNPQINSMKTNYSENRTETIGSQFPFIRRNAAVKYRTFPISGLISYFMDEEGHLFSSREEEYGTNLDDYNTFNNNNGIKNTTDYTYERLFRDKVINFLEDGEIKLFKSPTEGNILIRLMDINFSPIQTNGRMLWSFSATAYEMAEATIPNMEKYNINPADIDNNFGTDNYNNQIVTTTRMPHINGEIYDEEDSVPWSV